MQLDQVLVRGEELDRTPLAWLGERAAANSSKAILAELKKLDFLRELGVAEWQRLAHARRYPIVAAFLRHSMEEITDELVELYDRCLAQSYSRAGPRTG